MKVLSILALALTLGACSTAYYNTMEKFGVHKRNIMIDRAEEARDAQQDGQEQYEQLIGLMRDSEERLDPVADGSGAVPLVREYQRPDSRRGNLGRAR